MKFRIIKNTIKQGFQGMWRNRGMGLASVGSISAVLLILGLVIILILSINNVTEEMKSDFDLVQIYLENDISPEELKNIETTIRESQEVESFEFESREEAFENVKDIFGDESYILEGVENTEALPNSYILKVRSLEEVDLIVNRFKDMPGVESGPYDKELIDKLININNYIKLGGLAIIAALVLVSVFIISNTIKITVASRKREINIMKYVGATNGYIRGPFIIEGILFGLLGALLSIVLVKIGYEYFFQSASDKLYYLIVMYLVPPAALMKDISIIFISIGVGIGALGSIVSLKRYLNV